MKKVLVSLSTLLLLVGTFFISVGACPSNCCGNASTTITNLFLGIGKDRATASISRCGCLPVDNYLSANIRVQYYDGHNLYFDDPEAAGYYYYDSHNNAEQATISVDHYWTIWADGYYHARCGNDPQNSFHIYATK